ncbi:hypothetical protein C440_14119 [Haloferax mucosum ATCC BAA-1512]|uniref:DUF7511 domain-containing protein n=2 Tax=Haloferax mucosum TaxID=403181 RepID=M0I3X7_9EURY|nr:hypothetical protein C440_14119 [Haloferax mucosum ATCC BAA-1512]
MDSNVGRPSRPHLTSRIITRDDGREECTIHPSNAGPNELLTTWVTALDGTFVDLDTMR